MGKDQSNPSPSDSNEPSHKGITLAAWSKQGYEEPWVQQALDEIADVGATWVTITVTWYQHDGKANCFAPGPQSASDVSLQFAIKSAQERGLKVALKPMVDMESGNDRSEIQPIQEDTWFDCYADYISGYARLAESTGTDMVVIGTELSGVSQFADRWRRIAEKVGQLFAGRTTYAANFTEVEQIEFWDAVTYIGVDAYWPLSSEPELRVESLVEAWEEPVETMRNIAEETGQKVLLTELGYTSQSGTTIAPYDWEISTILSEEQQAAAFESAALAWTEEPFFAGVHIWMWDDAPGSGDQQELDYSPRNKLAEQTIRNWFVQLAQKPR